MGENKSLKTFVAQFLSKKVDLIILPLLVLLCFSVIAIYLFVFYSTSNNILLSNLFSDVSLLFLNLFLVFGLFVTFYYAFRNFKQENIDSSKDWESIRNLPETYDADLIGRLVKLEYRIKKLEAQSLLRVSVYAFLGAIIIAITITFLTKLIH